jgi:hypothetical protein
MCLPGACLCLSLLSGICLIHCKQPAFRRPLFIPPQYQETLINHCQGRWTSLPSSYMLLLKVLVTPPKLILLVPTFATYITFLHAMAILTQIFFSKLHDLCHNLSLSFPFHIAPKTHSPSLLGKPYNIRTRCISHRRNRCLHNSIQIVIRRSPKAVPRVDHQTDVIDGIPVRTVAGTAEEDRVSRLALRVGILSAPTRRQRQYFRKVHSQKKRSWR